MKRKIVLLSMATFAAIMFISFTLTSCGDGTQFQFMNTSSDTYRVTFDDDVEMVGPGASVIKDTKGGKHYYKYQQMTGYSIYPTIKEDTMTLVKGQEYMELIK